MDTLFLTGFPGFLGSALLPRLLEGLPGARGVCLVQARYLAEARRLLRRLEVDHPGLGGRVELTVGDITRPSLGLENPEDVARDVRWVHHAAALYDVTASRARSHRVNVEGTINVLDFAEGCPGLQRFHHVSTCYVSGRYPGLFRADQLDDAGPFNNVYEETKHRAEVEVRKRMDAGLPATVYRPAIVVGDRDTGRTQKFDGPYFVIRFLMRQPAVAVMPVVGDPHAVRANVVPRDFVADAVAHLSRLDASEGRTYQLADPTPLSVHRMLDQVGRALDKKVLRLPLPHGLARRALEAVPALERWIGIPAQALDYFTHPTRYDASGTLRELEGSGIRVPSFPEYVDTLVDFVREHPEIRSDAMA